MSVGSAACNQIRQVIADAVAREGGRIGLMPASIRELESAVCNAVAAMPAEHLAPSLAEKLTLSEAALVQKSTELGEANGLVKAFRNMMSTLQGTVDKQRAEWNQVGRFKTNGANYMRTYWDTLIGAVETISAAIKR